MTPKQEREMIATLFKMNDVCDQINQIDNWYTDNAISTRRYNQWQQMVRMWKDKRIVEEA